MITMTTLEDLDRAIDKLRKVIYGDFVLADDHNTIVECLQILSQLFECPKLNEVLGKIRTVRYGDTIEPDDHNLIVEAIIAIRECLGECLKLEELNPIIDRLRTVSEGDYVLSDDHNDKVEAIKVIRASFPMLRDLTVHVYFKPTGEDIQDATVTIEYNTTTETKYTDAEGLAKFFDITCGKIVHVTVEKTYYGKYEKEIKLTKDTLLEFGIGVDVTVTKYNGYCDIDIIIGKIQGYNNVDTITGKIQGYNNVDTITGKIQGYCDTTLS
mgnify:CR=1 FL=1